LVNRAPGAGDGGHGCGGRGPCIGAVFTHALLFHGLTLLLFCCCFCQPQLLDAMGAPYEAAGQVAAAGRCGLLWLVPGVGIAAQTSCEAS
jgi:hypothetical protein